MKAEPATIERERFDRHAPQSRTIGMLHGWGSLRRHRFAPFRVIGFASWAAWMSVRVCNSPVGRYRPRTALRSLWGWQLWRRLVRRGVVATLPDDSKLICPPWSRLVSVFVSEGFHEPDIALFLSDVLRSGDLFVDVGANIGFYSILAARRGARVVAFEPTLRCCANLVESAKLNDVADRIEAFPIALSSESGTALFTTTRDNTDMLVFGAAFLTDAERRDAARIEVGTIDDKFVDLMPLAIKIDAEGADLAVLKGAVRTIERCHPILVVEIFGGERAIRPWLESHRYELFRYIASSRELQPMGDNVDCNDNVIAIERDRVSFVKERLASAAPIPLHMPRISWTSREFAPPRSLAHAIK